MALVVVEVEVEVEAEAVAEGLVVVVVVVVEVELVVESSYRQAEHKCVCLENEKRPDQGQTSK